MLKLDAHHHFWNYDPVEYPWIDDNMSVIRRDFLPADLQAEMAPAGVSGAISVQARQTLEETHRLLEFAGQNDFIRGVVGWAPLVEPNVGDTLAELASNLKLRAVRHVLQDELDPFYALREDFNAGIGALMPLNLAYDILIFGRHLPQTITFVDKHPNQTFVLDHLGKPRVRNGEISPWRENIRDLAMRENVYCKISGLATEANYSSWTEAQLRPYLDTVLAAFGPQRLMFGSDWPVCLVAISYSHWISIVSNAIRSLTQSEQQRIWSGTAAEAYRLKHSLS
ncbi:MAG: amidohydrolase family protein [Bryobacteraceae bacterium]